MHSLWVNSKALEVAGIDKTVKDPVPGFSYYQRDGAGELTGYITEGAATQFWGLLETVTPSSKKTLKTFLYYLKDQGVTTLLDAGNFGVDQEIYEAIYELDQRGELPLKYHGSYTLFLPQDRKDAIESLKKLSADYSGDRVKIDTLKIFFDGVIDTRTAYMTEDYLDTPGNRGEGLFKREELLEIILELEKEGLNLHFHTDGNQAIKTVLNAVEDAHKSLGRAPKIRIALSHLELMDDEDMIRFKSLGVIAQITPAWNGGDDSEGYRNALGEKVDNMFLTQGLFREGAAVSFSSDAYFKSDWDNGNANPFTGIQIGHTRQFIEGGAKALIRKPLAERISLKNLVDGYTRNGAYQLGIENQVGSLEPGKQADFIVLNQNIFEIDKYSIHQTKPDAVILDGKIVHGALENK